MAEAPLKASVIEATSSTLPTKGSASNSTSVVSFLASRPTTRTFSPLAPPPARSVFYGKSFHEYCTAALDRNTAGWFTGRCANAVDSDTRHRHVRRNPSCCARFFRQFDTRTTRTARHLDEGGSFNCWQRYRQAQSCISAEVALRAHFLEHRFGQLPCGRQSAPNDAGANGTSVLIPIGCVLRFFWVSSRACPAQKTSFRQAGPTRNARGLLIEINTEEVSLRRTARTDVVVRRHARRYIVLIDQTRAGNPREIRFTDEALCKGGRRGPGLDGYHRCF